MTTDKASIGKPSDSYKNLAAVLLVNLPIKAIVGWLAWGWFWLPLGLPAISPFHIVGLAISLRIMGGVWHDEESKPFAWLDAVIQPIARALVAVAVMGLIRLLMNIQVAWA